MTINNTTPFMAKKKQEKREFIENIFNLSVFSEALVRLKTDLSDKRKTHEIEVAKYDENDRSLKRQEKIQQEAGVERDRKKALLLQRKQQNAQDVEKLRQELDSIIIESTETIDKSINVLEDGIKKIDSMISTLTQEKAVQVATKQQLSKQINRIGTEDEVCPVCLRSIEEHNRDYIEKEKEKINTAIATCDAKVEEYNNNIADLNTKKNKINTKITELKNVIHSSHLKVQEKKNLNARIKHLTETLTIIEEDLKDIDNTVASFDVDLNQQRDALIKSRKHIESLATQLQILDVAKFVFSEEGVKSVVIKKILQLFNGKLAYYLNKMDANCTCTFNEYFEEEIKDIKGKVCSYFNFSGAERKNIDLACLFTFMDMRRLQGDVSFNFSIYDELFDSSLDERGVDLVINILNERVDLFSESIMVISHRKESIKAATGDIIFLEKKNGITRRVDFTTLIV